jgi:hypothetical protein
VLGPAVSIALLGLMVACADLTGPDRVDPPRLRTLSLTDDLLATNLRDGGVFFISATPVDTSFRLPRGQRLPLSVTVSSGDEERAGLSRRHCPARERTTAGYPCFKFQVFMKEGHRPLELADQVAAVGGRFYLVSSNFAGVIMFEPELVRQARAATRWPGVAYAALMGTGCLPEAPCLNSNSDLVVPMPLDFGAAIPGDGIVQVRSGDVVTATYQQPNGGTIQATAQVP